MRVCVPRHSGEGSPLPSAVCKPGKVNSSVVVAAVVCLKHWSSAPGSWFQPVSVVLMIFTSDSSDVMKD